MGEPSPIGILELYLYSPSSPRCQTTAATNFTNRSWAELVLLYLNALMHPPMAPIPLTKNNIENIMRWNQAENKVSHVPWWGNPTDQYPNRTNPLNNGQGPPNGNPLGTYTDLNQAAYFVAQLLLYGHRYANYGAIVAALQDDASPAVFSAAVVQSSFAVSRYGVKAAIDAYNAKNPPDPIPSIAVVKDRELDFLASEPVPPETPAPASHGKNLSPANGVGWGWLSPQAWQPNLDMSFPGEPDMPLPSDLMSIDPINLATYNATTGFGQAPPQPSTGGTTGGGTTGGGTTGGGTTGGGTTGGGVTIIVPTGTTGGQTDGPPGGDTPSGDE